MDTRESLVKPQHPLPKEIQLMKRDETVCQFCGVSYLIHNEIKKLEEEVSSLQKKLKQYEGFDEKERRLVEQLATERSKSKEMNEKLMSEEERNKSLENHLKEVTLIKEDFEGKYDLCNARLKEREITISTMTTKSKELKKLLADVQKDVIHIKSEKDTLLKAFTDLRSEEKEKFLKVYTVMEEISSQNEKERNQKIKECIELKREIDEYKENCIMLKDGLGKLEETAKTKKDLELSLMTKTKELEKNIFENKKLVDERESLCDALTKIKSLLSERNGKLNEMESALKEREKVLKNARDEKERLEQEFKHEKENIYKQLNDREDEIEILKKSSDKGKEEITTASVQLKVLKECMDKAKIEAAELKKEREDMIVAHQNRISQLRESFQQKMLEADSWPKKLEEKLTAQRLQLNEEKNRLWEELSNSFQKELQELHDTHEKEKDEIRKSEKLKCEKIQRQYETLQKRSREEIVNMESILTKNKEIHENMHRSQEALIQNLELKIADLESRLVSMQKRAVDDDGSYKQRYLDTKRALDYIKSDFEQLEQDLFKKRDEISLLQETVRRECEERFELTDALSEARLKLLAVEKRTPTSKHLQNKMVPSPPATGTGRFKGDKANSTETMEGRVKPTQCSTNQETGVTFPLSRSISEEDNSRRRIADALAKQRASSRASFDKFR